MNERSIFLEVLEKQNTAERAAYLDSACAGDAALRQRVEALLQSHDQAPQFMGKLAPQLLFEALAVPMTTDDTPADRLAADTGDLDLDFLSPADKPGLLGRLGHYQVNELIGRSGMSIVLKGFDEKLHRVIAIKVMNPELAVSAVARKRFAREAQAAAAVCHDHVVDIHAVEEIHELPCIIMQYVAGGSLRARLRKGEPLAAPEVARIGIEAAAGLAAAHAVGLVHRDVKPANILQEEGTGRIRITDFGLARAVTDGSLSQAGVIAGTPQYMAPEQARGQPLDHRADIYSLGVTLYELATGKPAIAGGSTPDVLRRVETEEPLPPRLLNRAIPVDLETVILKAMAKDAGERYATVRELGEDLERYLKDEPIQARRPGWVQRTRKWLRRHPATVASSVLVLVLALVALTVGMVALNDERGRTQLALTEEAKRRREAREAFDDLTSLMVEDLLAKQETLTEEHKNFLRKALQSYEKFATDTATDAASRHGVARANYNIGRIQYRLGAMPEALAAFSRSVELYMSLAADFAADESYRYGLAQSQLSVAPSLWNAGRFQEAEAESRRALALCEQLVAEFPNIPDYREQLFRSRRDLAFFLDKTGRLQEAEANYLSAMDLGKQLVAEFPKSSRHWSNLAIISRDLGLLLGKTGQLDKASAAHREALILYKQLAADFPALPQYRQGLADSNDTMGSLLRMTGKLDEAEAAFREALRLHNQLAADFPSVPFYRARLARARFYLGGLLHENDRREEAETAYRDAIALQKQLAADFPAASHYGRELAATYSGLAAALDEMGRRQEAETAFRETLAMETRLAAEFPDLPGSAQALARCQANLGHLLLNMARLQEAEPLLHEACRRLQGLPADLAADPRNRADLANSLNNLGVLFEKSGRAIQSEKAYREALALRKQLALEFPDLPAYQNSVAGSMVNLSLIHLQRKEPEVARQLLEQALPHHEAALKANPRHPVYRAFYRNNRLRLTFAFLNLGDHRAAAAMAEELVKASIDPARDRYDAVRYLATCAVLAKTDARQAQTYADRAVALLAEALHHGFRDTQLVDNDKALAPLRSRADFKELLAELKAKVKR